MNLFELNGLVKLAFLVILINRSDSYIIPKGNTIIKAGDTLYIAASTEHFGELFARFGKASKTIKTVLVLGGDLIGQTVAGFLSGCTDLPKMKNLDAEVESRLFGKRRVRLIEANAAICKMLSEKLPDVEVIRGDIADETLFDEEQLQDCDAILAVSASEEHNIVSAVYGKRRGIKRALCLVKSGNYLSVARHLDVDVAISLRNSVAASVLGIIREGRVASVQTLGDGSVEILEFMPEPESPVLGKTIKSIGFPSQTLVLAIARDGKSFIASGPSIIQEQDRILVLTRKEKNAEVQELFKAKNK